MEIKKTYIVVIGHKTFTVVADRYSTHDKSVSFWLDVAHNRSDMVATFTYFDCFYRAGFVTTSS